MEEGRGEERRGEERRGRRTAEVKRGEERRRWSTAEVKLTSRNLLSAAEEEPAAETAMNKTTRHNRVFRSMFVFCCSNEC